VLDGIDGCGKSTQARHLVARLAGRGGPAPLHLREPGSTYLGERLRTLLLDPAGTLGPVAELLLFAAARRQLLDELVAPALVAGRDVVCERFHGSTFAYQAVAGGLPEHDVQSLLERWCDRPSPDLELILDLDVDTAFGRRGADRDRIEGQGLEFQRRVAAGYRRYAELRPQARLIPAAGGEAEVAAAIAATLEDSQRCR
jgi:dTMP kinase